MCFNMTASTLIEVPILKIKRPDNGCNDDDYHLAFSRLDLLEAAAAAVDTLFVLASLEM